MGGESSRSKEVWMAVAEVVEHIAWVTCPTNAAPMRATVAMSAMTVRRMAVTG